MSTGLMSCVRENSPPLEGVSIQQDDGEHGFSHSPEPTETQKRRRFHPLRNLRRIFRRRTVPRGDFTGHSGDNCSSIPSGGTSQMVNSSDSSSPPSIVDVTASGSLTSGGYTTTIYLTKDRLEGGNFDNRTGRIGKRKDVLDDMEQDMTDYQRSFSDGLLLDSGYSREALSQSHDSVFSESATASSLSIVLKAELVDVLRKRRNRPDASDEDLGLPHSPSTPQRKDCPLNQSEGSLSLLSMVSTDMEPEPYSPLAGANATAKRSLDIFQVPEEQDLNLSSASKLSHSAARHKMAVRPNKKKGPTRHRRAIEMKNNALPATPELNEDALKARDALDKKVRSKSLPPGVNAKMMAEQSSNCLPTQTSSTESSSSTIYVNPQLSKSYAFEKESVSSSEDQRQDGAFEMTRNVRNAENGDKFKMDEGKSKVMLGEKRQPRSGAAARQRIHPKDLTPEVPRSTKIAIGEGDIPKICDFLPRSEPKINLCEKVYNQGGIAIKCHDTVTPIRGTERESTDAVAPPPKVVWPDGVGKQQLRPDVKTVDVRKAPRRKSVEKSKSFRFYCEGDAEKMPQNHLPSLPDLSLAAFDDKSAVATRRNSFKNAPSMKFEINDNNLVKPKEEVHHFESSSCGKNIILTPNKFTTNTTNISQIEENIDKLVKSTFVTVLKKSPDNCTEVVEAKIRHTRDVEEVELREDGGKARRSTIFDDDPKIPEFMKIQLNRVDSTRPKSHVVLSKNVKETTTRRHSTEILEGPKVAQDERKQAPKVIQSPQHVAAPKIVAKKTFMDGIQFSEPVRTTDALNEVKTLLAERRLSVSDEKAKIERRLSVSDETKGERASRKTSEDSSTPCLRKASSDDENVVVMRKKSSGASKEDNTPELMKVFARRSLKLKDTDEEQCVGKINGKSTNIDSDKENQSSSEEKLDRLAKCETNGNFTKPPSGKVVVEEKFQVTKKETCDNYRKGSIIAAKPLAANSPNRFSINNVLTYRTTTPTFHDIRKSLGVSTATIDASNQTNNNNTLSNGISNVVNNNNNPPTNGRPAENQNSTEDSLTDEDICEFKGILQRRAEWEKRAKDACK